ncbi:unnamed protein product [Moneuplotes crassus]|uniref:Uncharacterized protein n=1 Tax=Euplotes crassus TaxID=5936 RepID=A0AAD1UCH1_EUPCR|nr:unnamed protein product [Moneuplotes crassus]
MTLNIDKVKSEMKKWNNPIKKNRIKKASVQKTDSMEQSLYGNEDTGSSTQRRKMRRKLFSKLKRFKTLEFKTTNQLVADLKESLEANKLNAAQGKPKVKRRRKRFKTNARLKRKSSKNLKFQFNGISKNTNNLHPNYLPNATLSKSENISVQEIKKEMRKSRSRMESLILKSHSALSRKSAFTNAAASPSKLDEIERTYSLSKLNSNVEASIQSQVTTSSNYKTRSNVKQDRSSSFQSEKFKNLDLKRLMSPEKKRSISLMSKSESSSFSNSSETTKPKIIEEDPTGKKIENSKESKPAENKPLEMIKVPTVDTKHFLETDVSPVAEKSQESDSFNFKSEEKDSLIKPCALGNEQESKKHKIIINNKTLLNPYGHPEIPKSITRRSIFTRNAQKATSNAYSPYLNPLETLLSPTNLFYENPPPHSPNLPQNPHSKRSQPPPKIPVSKGRGLKAP